jgi:hypothetical protein
LILLVFPAQPAAATLSMYCFDRRRGRILELFSFGYTPHPVLINKALKSLSNLSPHIRPRMLHPEYTA